MANVAKNAILRAKINDVLTDIMVKTTTSQVYVDETTTLAAHLATLAAKADVQALQETVDKLGALGQKDKISYADLETALAALIDGKAEASELEALNSDIDALATMASNRLDAADAAAKAAKEAADAAQGDVDALEGRMDTAEGKLTTLIGADADKSVRTIANEELAAQLIGENAKESLNELHEIAAWIQSHPEDAAAMNESIVALQNKLVLGTYVEGDETKEYATVKAYVEAVVAALNMGDYAKAADLTALSGDVDLIASAADSRLEALEGITNGLGDLATKDIVSESDLSAELAEKVNAASEGNHSHLNKTVLDGITTEKVTAWDAAEQNAKTHATDLNTAMNTRVLAVEEKKHEHANKTVLDGITTDVVAAWNAKGNIYYSASEPANMTANDLWVALID